MNIFQSIALAILGLTITFVEPAAASSLTADQQKNIDDSVQEWLHKTGAPSVSIAVVSEGALAYAKAYGAARLDPLTPATVEMRYPIGSVSKQFTASAILLLQQNGLVSLDDPVSKYVPSLAGAGVVTIREVLSHTGGFRDYTPLDYMPLGELKPTTPENILDSYAKGSLDFQPGTDWQYSSTDYVIAAKIVEGVSHQPLMNYLYLNIFDPLHMHGVADYDAHALPDAALTGYTTYDFGPVRQAPVEAVGWKFGAGELAMSPSTLALWDASLINRSLLQPKTYETLFSSEKLKSGKDTNYSLGLSLRKNASGLVAFHGGSVSGFNAQNYVWLSQRVAVVVLSNGGWLQPREVVERVSYVVLPPTAAEAQVRHLFDAFKQGKIERSLFTDGANAYFTPSVLVDQAAGLGAMGPMRTIRLIHEETRGGEHFSLWRIVTAAKIVVAAVYTLPNGKIDQFIIGDP
ncbi:MAG: serine hydrolase domain-containing protein [Caulobacteraceae bacterium]